MSRVTSILCHVSNQYAETCQIIIWISIWPYICYFYSISIHNFKKLF